MKTLASLALLLVLGNSSVRAQQSQPAPLVDDPMAYPVGLYLDDGHCRMLFLLPATTLPREAVSCRPSLRIGR